MKEIVFDLPAENSGERVDSLISRWLIQNDPENAALFTRSFVQKLIKDGAVLINNKKVSKSQKTKERDKVLIQLPDPEPAEAAPENIPLNIVYEDDDVLVVNKPKGMVVHPAPGNPNGTLVNALLWHCSGKLSGINGVLRPGIVHRIDKDTSGLLVVAKNDNAHLKLSEQISTHSFKRIYYAVVYGRLKEKSGTIDAPIGRSTTDRKKYTVTDKNSKNAVTDYEVIEEIGNYSFVQFRLHTGRTHQIRVHMASIGHPIAGDPVYGPKKIIKELNGQCLHAGCLGFVHPTTDQYMEFNSELPEYFTSFLDKLRREQDA